MAQKKILDVNPEPEAPELSILCLNIDGMSKIKQFLICSITVFIFFIIYGYMQELIFTIEGFNSFGWFLTMIQFLFYTVFGALEMKVRNVKGRRIPFKMYFFLAALTLGTMGFSNYSLAYLNYPTQVIFKCCKLIPVMAGSIVIQGKRYGPLDFCAAYLMCIGLTLFILADSKVHPNFNTTGIVVISMALLCDAIIGNVQEKSMKGFGAPNVEVVFYSYGIGFVYLFLFLVVSGNFMEGLEFYSQNPKKLYGYTFLFSLSGYLGIQVVLTLVRTCGAFVAVTVTTCRKAITIIISFMFFSKPFTMQYVWSGLLVILGIYLNLFNKKYPVSFASLQSSMNKCMKQMKIKLLARKYKTGQYMANV